MAGLFKNLFNLGAAYVQHVTAVRNALALPEAEALATLSSYLRGLSDVSFVGFKISVAGLAGKETDNAVKQNLQRIVANADALRLGKFETAPANAASEPEPGLSFDAALELINPWFSLPQQECRAHLHAALARMSGDERRQFVVHLRTAVEQQPRKSAEPEEQRSQCVGRLHRGSHSVPVGQATHRRI